MKRYLYLLLGLATLTLALTISFWFWDELKYLATSETAQIRIGITLLSWIMAVIYLYYSLKPKKINFLSDLSAIILLITPIIYLILAFFTCYRVGGYCSVTSKIINQLD